MLDQGMDRAANNPLLAAIGGDEGFLADRRRRQMMEQMPQPQPGRREKILRALIGGGQGGRGLLSILGMM